MLVTLKRNSNDRIIDPISQKRGGVFLSSNIWKIVRSDLVEIVDFND